MSGTEVPDPPDPLSHLKAVLGREVELAVVNALQQAISHRTLASGSLGRTAIGFDSSVFLRIPTHKKSSDILDYLPKHGPPLILPGQAIQEFWNNHYSVVDSVGRSIGKKFETFAKEARVIGEQFAEFETQAARVLADFEERFGYVYSDGTRENLKSSLQMFAESTFTAFVPRLQFKELADVRKSTKTPPGFKDVGDGDFYVWADFLYSLLLRKGARSSFDHVVIVTNDTKSDWSVGGVPHPIMTAEVAALFGASFDLWNLDRLASEIGRASQPRT